MTAGNAAQARADAIKARRAADSDAAIWEQAAQRVDREVAAEEARLIAAGHPDPWNVPMLANWLGGLRTAAQVLRDEGRRYPPGQVEP